MRRTLLHIAIYAGSTLLYACLLYATPRTSFFQLLGLFAALFAGYFLIIGKSLLRKPLPSFSPLQWRSMLLAAIAFRLLAVFSLPNLSDDYYRFVWDGRLLSHGANPFLKLPSEYMQQPDVAAKLGLSQQLYQGLNSPNYFTIYPPLNQAVFWMAARVFPRDLYAAVVCMKGVLFLAELGSLYLLFLLLARWKLPREYLAIYALNPLVIAELVGNLHFEALMIVFLLWSMYLFEVGKWRIAAAPYALAVCSKLLPLMLLPLLLRRLGFRRSLIFGLLLALGTGLCFLPFFDLHTFRHLMESVSLYFQKFEFNASIYYLLRWVGFQVKGYNIIQTAGKYLSAITLAGILLIALLERRPRWKTLPASMLWAFVLYFGLASIVHPWYICTLVALATLCNWRFPLIWAALLPLTYFTYISPSYQENLYLVATEYVLVLIWMVWEISKEDFNKIRTNFALFPFKRMNDHAD